MTIHDFIIIYNETFKFIEDKYGVEAVEDLWATISKQWCGHLRELVETKGLEGMLEYWGGNDGTLLREKAVSDAGLSDGIFYTVMHKCPSVEELIESGREIYHGKLSYCDHCPPLYTPIAEENGYEMGWMIDRDEEGKCTGRCKWFSYKKE